MQTDRIYADYMSGKITDKELVSLNNEQEKIKTQLYEALKGGITKSEGTQLQAMQNHAKKNIQAAIDNES